MKTSATPKRFLRAVQGCDQVIHAAGQFRFLGMRSLFWQTNVAGTHAMLAAATAVSVQRFIHISTVVVIGGTPAASLIDETAVCHPLEPYQRTKYEAEQLALAYHRAQRSARHCAASWRILWPLGALRLQPPLF
ncbi:MAG: NAD-dependent epimerase/dehydratase family protein [Chloroflexi bacterium]|nr:NAD-dependent epimerase/dehydratase family protein [Chloroflexota bacterium]